MLTKVGILGPITCFIAMFYVITSQPNALVTQSPVLPIVHPMGRSVAHHEHSQGEGHRDDNAKVEGRHAFREETHGYAV